MLGAYGLFDGRSEQKLERADAAHMLQHEGSNNMPAIEVPQPVGTTTIQGGVAGLTLIGTMEYADADNSTALIVHGQRAQSYVVGDILPGGGTLHSVFARSVYVSTGAGLVVLEIESGQAEPATVLETSDPREALVADAYARIYAESEVDEPAVQPVDTLRRPRPVSPPGLTPSKKAALEALALDD